MVRRIQNVILNNIYLNETKLMIKLNLIMSKLEQTINNNEKYNIYIYLFTDRN